MAQPMRSSTWGKAASPWLDSRLRLVMVTRPPVKAAAAQKYEALEASASI